MVGYIHSLESFGTVDGPGIRYVVFFQGCPMRCLYCHNPDTWHLEQGKSIDSDTIIHNILKNIAFYRKGGITATGGEPLLQLDYLIELFRKAKQNGIHTCLDTSGILFSKEKEEKFLELIKVTDLVLLDIKHMDEQAHHQLTGHSNQSVFEFAKFLNAHQVPMWIRRVVVEGYTDSEEELRRLGIFIKGLSNVKKIEVLPYHTMALEKYEKLNLTYPLGTVLALTKEDAQRAYDIITGKI